MTSQFARRLTSHHSDHAINLSYLPISISKRQSRNDNTEDQENIQEESIKSPFIVEKEINLPSANSTDGNAYESHKVHSTNKHSISNKGDTSKHKHMKLPHTREPSREAFKDINLNTPANDCHSLPLLHVPVERSEILPTQQDISPVFSDHSKSEFLENKESTEIAESNSPEQYISDKNAIETDEISSGKDSLPKDNEEIKVDSQCESQKPRRRVRDGFRRWFGFSHATSESPCETNTPKDTTSFEQSEKLNEDYPQIDTISNKTSHCESTYVDETIATRPDTSETRFSDTSSISDKVPESHIQKLWTIMRCHMMNLNKIQFPTTTSN
ncbi:unnamed protein product [Ambrosiozyma monospora]|uniref:Unnamed protein product n=1 Tax=Ambrosiozyma monospora TaxID=43982 RepID=A0ACB5TIZ2_AMBMO|nr:unnamed protein product [Ambrosiozyma monospora]